MTDEIAPESTDVSETTDATAQVAPDPSKAAKELEQRVRGLDAKVTTLQKERDALSQKVQGLESGQINADATLQAQLQAKDQEIAELRSKAAAIPKLTQYPKAARTLGESIGALSDEVLADLEAQLTLAGISDEPAPPAAKPPPVPANPPNSDGSDISGLDRQQLLDRMAKIPWQ
jgi:predicted  nucleic acid-binding Zn-ribbon protein